MEYVSTGQNSRVLKTSDSLIDFNKQVQNYAIWLAREARSHSLNERQDKMRAYREKALEPITVSGQEIHAFAPFQPEHSALRTTTPRQRILLRIVALAYVLGLIIYSTPGLEILIALISIFYICDLLLYFYLSLRVLDQSTGEHIDREIVRALEHAEWPYYTILCPLYHEVEILPQFVQAMSDLDYPEDRLQVLLLTEEEDIKTRQVIQEMQLPNHFELLVVPAGEPRTKPRACNYGLLHATGDFVVIYDAEDIPEPLQLKKAILTFAQHGPDLACVQAKLNYYNIGQNLLTRWFTAEYSSWFDMTLPGLQKLGVPLPLGGTSNHFRAELLRMAGAWDVFNVTEDCDLGLRLGHYHLKTIMVDSTTSEEANLQVRNWLRQRARWIKGYMQTYLVHMRYPLVYLRAGRRREFLALQMAVGGKTAILFVNPLMWMLLIVYILFHASVVNAYHLLYPQPILYLATLCLIFGNFMYIYIHILGCMKRGQYSLAKWALLMPVYWALASVAAYIALYQLVFKPHYWEKTLHGLHLRTSHPSPRTTAIKRSGERITIPLSPPVALTAEELLRASSEEAQRVEEDANRNLSAPQTQLATKSTNSYRKQTVPLTEVSEKGPAEVPAPKETLAHDATRRKAAQHSQATGTHKKTAKRRQNPGTNKKTTKRSRAANTSKRATKRPKATGTRNGPASSDHPPVGGSHDVED